MTGCVEVMMDAQSERAAEPDIEGLRAAYSYLRSDPERARKEFSVLADSGSLMSLVYLGSFYEDGLGVEIDLSKADAFYERAYSQGSVSAAFALARTAWNRRNYKRAKELYTWGVEKNDPRAMYWLAKLYILGHVQTADRFEAAIPLLERARQLGHLESEFKLGKIWMSGRRGVGRILPGLKMYILAAVTAGRLSVYEPTSDRLLDIPERLLRPSFTPKSRH